MKRVILFLSIWAGWFMGLHSQPFKDFPIQYSPKPRYRVPAPQTYYVPLRDGVHLAVDVYVPKGKSEEKFPTLLYQTRYWRGVELVFPLSLFKKIVPSTHNFDVLQFVKYGYALVCVDVRGTGASEGKKTSALSGVEEMDDAKDIIEWILQQKWSNGKIGTLGISYIGMAAQMTLFNFHPAVLACAPMYSAFDYYDDLSYPGGVFNKKLTKIWNDFCKSLDQNQLPKIKSNFLNELLSNNVRPVQKDRKRLQTILQQRNNWYFDSEEWSIPFPDDSRTQNGWVSIDSIRSPHMMDFRKVTVPILAYTGWWDATFTKGSIKIFKNYPCPQNQLIIGPWKHGGDWYIEEAYLGKNRFRHIEPVLAFFDKHLKNLPTPYHKVIYFTLNQNQWKTCAQFPPENIEYKSFSLTSQAIQFQTSPHTTNGDATRYNLELSHLGKRFPDRKALDEQKLVFDFHQAGEDIVITGMPSLKLVMKTQNPDPKVFAVLEEVLPDGRVKYITEGTFRLIHRKAYAEPLFYEYQAPYHSFFRKDAAFMPADEFQTVEFLLEPISYLVRKGSKIRLALSSSELDTFAVSEADHWEISPLSQITLPVEK